MKLKVGIPEWKKYDYYTNRYDDKRIKKEEAILQTKDSNENKQLGHNLIEIVYVDGDAFYIYASDPKEEVYN